MENQRSWNIIGLLLALLGIAVSIGVGFWPDIVGPSIVTFQANDNTNTLIRGGSVVLTWRVKGSPDDVLLNGQRVAASGEKEFGHLTRDQEFRLEARKRGKRTDSQLIRVHVVPPPIQVVIDASPNPVKPGTETTLSWNASNAETVDIEPLFGAVGLKGKRPVSVPETTTFRITASAPGVQDASSQVTVEVSQTHGLFRAEPATIHRGETTKLVWQTNAESIEISPGVGVFPESSGETIVSPVASTTYEAVVADPGGQQKIRARVEVLPPARPKVMVLTSEVTSGFGGGGLLAESTGLVPSYVKARGYDILLTPSYIRSPEQFLDLSQRPQAGFQMPNLVIQASLDIHQETHKPAKAQLRDFVGSLLNNRNSVEDRYVEVVITCISTIRLVRMPEGQVTGSLPGRAQGTKIVDRSEAQTLANPASDFSRTLAEQSIESALNRLNLQVVE